MEKKDKYIVDEIRNYREEIDMNDLWDHVSPHIPKPKKKRRMPFWIFGALILFLSFGTLLSVFVLNDPSERSLTLSESSRVKKSKIHTNVKENEGQSSAVTEKTTTKSLQKVVEDKNENKRLGINTSRQAFQTHEEYKTRNFSKNNQINTSGLESGINGVDESSGLKITLYNNEKSEENYNDENFRYTGSTPKDLEGYGIVKPLNILESKIQFLKFNRVNNFIVTPINQKMNPISQKMRWSSYILGGGALIRQCLTTEDNELVNESDRIEEITDVLGGWHFEAGLGFKMSSKIKLSIGLGYQQILERAQFETKYLVDNDVEINTFVHRQDGTVENDIKTETVSGTRYTNEKRYNEFKMLRIPLRLSYRLLNIQGIQFEIEGMTSIALRQSHEGFTSFSLNEPSYDLSTDNEMKFRKSGALSFGIGIKGGLHLNRMTDVTVRWGLEKLRNIATKEYLIDQQYTLYTLDCGLTRRF